MALTSRRSFLGICAACAQASLLSPAWVVAQRQSVPHPPDAGVVDDLVAANRILANEQVLDAYGHVSVRHPRMPDRFLLARSIAPELVTSADILEYDLDGNAIDARGRTSYKERFIHSEIYRARQTVGAIVHCHTPSLIPFGVVGQPLRPIYHQSAFIAAGVPVFDIRSAAGMTNMLIEDARLGKSLATALGDKPAALMRGHGAVIVADTIPTVVGRSVYLDMNARLQAEAMALGGNVTYLDPEEARLYAASDNYQRAWDLWKRKVAGAIASPKGR
jgi:ribulose-5-phosphate 4-epimerase/fuculose-1-phosphate aldolase